MVGRRRRRGRRDGHRPRSGAHRPRRRRHRPRALERIAPDAESPRDGGVARSVVQRPRPRRGRRDARHLGDRRVRRRRAGVRHRHPPSFDPGASAGVGRARGRRGVHRAGDGRLRLRGGQVAPRPGQRAEHRGARCRGARGRSLRGRRRLVPRGHRVPRVGQRPARQAVGACRRGRADRRHLPVGRLGHEPRRRRRRDGRRRRPRPDRLRPAAAASRPLRPPGARRPAGAADRRCATPLVELQQTSQDVRSPWLVNRATYELDDFDESVAEHLPALQNALRAIELAPEMLGADGPRTYLLLFTTPSESRALGGFIGSYAELTVTDGQLALGRLRPRPRTSTRAVVRGGGHDDRPRGVRPGVRALRLRHRRQRRRRRRRVPQPRPDGQLPVGRRDRQRALHEDDGPQGRRRHRHGPVRRGHAARLHGHGPPRLVEPGRHAGERRRSSCCATST